MTFSPHSLDGDALDAACLHLWDRGVRPLPAWAQARHDSMVARGWLRRENHKPGYVFVAAGADEAARRAGRDPDAPRPAMGGCGCAICNAAAAPEVDPYVAFLEAKIPRAQAAGLAFDGAVNPALAPHTQALVRWALAGGRRAIFADFGLHKTAAQLELMRIISGETGQACLIVAPLGVRIEFQREAAKRFAGDFAVTPLFIRSDDDIEAGRVHITNYESVREGKIDPSRFIAATLDEAAILRSFGSKTYQSFLPLFSAVRYRFVATATPSPNRLKELIHYAGFLGVMDTGQALTRFFQRNSEQANDLTLYPHKEREFWLWVHSWAAFVTKPSDLGFDDAGYALPPLTVRWRETATDHTDAGVERDGQMLLFRNAALGVQAAAAEKRRSLGARLALAAEIISEEPHEARILWHDLEVEREALEDAFGCASIHGGMSIDARESAVMDFVDGRTQLFATKPILSGAGCNFQHCARAIFLGVGFKFHDFIQAVHRIWRFGQTRGCVIDIIHTEAEREIVADLKRKWALHEEMREKMQEIIREHGLGGGGGDALKRSIGVRRDVVTAQRFAIAHNDAVMEARALESESLDLIVTSVPFANQYEYTPTYEDFGHTDDNAHFWAQMDFLTPHLLRALRPGRLACVHVKDRILFGNVTGKGAPTVAPFHAEGIFHFMRHGFDFMGMITVVTDVVRENNQTYRLGWSEQCKDGTKMGVGSPEYVLLMRKPQSDRTKSYADLPVVKSKEAYSRARWQTDAHAFWRSSGERLPTAEEWAALGPDKLATVYTRFSLERVYDHAFHTAIGEALDARGALPSTFMALAPGSHAEHVWHDVNRMRTLNSEQSRRAVEMHICPLQFDIVDRLIERYSNPDELVFDPFMGLGTVPYRAILKGRRGGGSEINPASFADAAYYCAAAEQQHAVPSLFDLEDAA